MKLDLLKTKIAQLLSKPVWIQLLKNWLKKINHIQIRFLKMGGNLTCGTSKDNSRNKFAL